MNIPKTIRANADSSRFSGLAMGTSALILLLAGCAASSNQVPATSGAASAPAAAIQSPAPPASAPTPSALSYGTATGRVKKDVTTQQELLDLFGGPSVMTTDKDGAEVWMYDKTTSTVSGSTDQNARQASQSDASTMAYYFGIPFVADAGRVNSSEKDQSSQEGHAQNSFTSSVKTITFIIRFNPDKTVKEYAVRQASY